MATANASVHAAVRGYHLPWRVAVPLGRDVALGRTRPFASDCTALLAAAPLRPLVSGTEQIPPTGPFVLIANHLEGPGLWIGWSAALLTAAINAVRSDPVPVHWLVQRDMDRARVQGWKRLTPATSWAFARVASAWSMASLPRSEDPRPRAAAVRSLLRLALPPPRGRGRPVGFFPEGERGSLCTLAEPAPGAGALLALLARHGVPALPAGVWLQENRLHGRFGPAFLVSRYETAAGEAMEHVARLLPPRMHGRHAVLDACERLTAAPAKEPC
jgi:1-acyl-sn-glycerol-3-phosphate acyltransferase